MKQIEKQTWLNRNKLLAIGFIILLGVLMLTVSLFFSDGKWDDIFVNLGTEFLGGAAIIYVLELYIKGLTKTVHFEEISGYEALYDIMKKLKTASQVYNTRIASENWEEAFKKNNNKAVKIYQGDLRKFPDRIAEAVNNGVRVSELCSKAGESIYNLYIKKKIEEGKEGFYSINLIDGDFPFLNYTIIESKNNEKELWYGWLLTENEGLENQRIIVTKDDTFIEKILKFHMANVKQPKLNRDRDQFKMGSLQELSKKVLDNYNQPFKEVCIYGNYLWRITPLFESGALHTNKIRLIAKYDNKKSKSENGNSTTLSNLSIIRNYAVERNSSLEVRTHTNQPTEYYVLFDDKILIHGNSTPSEVKSSLDVDLLHATLYTNESPAESKEIDYYQNHFDRMFKTQKLIDVY